jgi:hypothetical protein
MEQARRAKAARGDLSTDAQHGRQHTARTNRQALHPRRPRTPSRNAQSSKAFSRYHARPIRVGDREQPRRAQVSHRTGSTRLRVGVASLPRQGTAFVSRASGHVRDRGGPPLFCARSLFLERSRRAVSLPFDRRWDKRPCRRTSASICGRIPGLGCLTNATS